MSEQPPHIESKTEIGHFTDAEELRPPVETPTPPQTTPPRESLQPVPPPQPTPAPPTPTQPPAIRPPNLPLYRPSPATPPPFRPWTPSATVSPPPVFSPPVRPYVPPTPPPQPWLPPISPYHPPTVWRPPPTPWRPAPQPPPGRPAPPVRQLPSPPVLQLADRSTRGQIRRRASSTPRSASDLPSPPPTDRWTFPTEPTEPAKPAEERDPRRTEVDEHGRSVWDFSTDPPTRIRYINTLIGTDDLVQWVMEAGAGILAADLIKGASGFFRARRAAAAARALEKARKAAESVAAAARAAARARANELVQAARARGDDVVVNIGGAGAKHEPANAINLNNQAVARHGIPNLVEADGADIGEILPEGKVDRIEGHNMAPGAVDWSRGASGAYRVLRPGGTFQYYYRGANADAPALGQALRDAGFRDVQVVGDVLVKAVK